MSGLRFIKLNPEGLLFDQNMGLRNIDINPFRVAVRTGDFLFKAHTVSHTINIKDVMQNVNPVGSGVFVFAAFPIPFIVKLSGSFPLLSVRHDQLTSCSLRVC